MSWVARVLAASDVVRRRWTAVPEVAVILGSGLGALADRIAADVIVPYDEIPHFPRPAVEGHRGRLVLGTLQGRTVAAMQGRAHYYEGHTIADVVLPVRVLHELGARTLIITNAAGGLNSAFRAGDLMIISDHINFTGANPLIGPNEAAWGTRFPDMSAAYDPALAELADGIARNMSLSVRRGVYVGVTGPSYETPAELRMMARWGADAVGMSTVNEVIAARHAGMRVLGISAITNLATGQPGLAVTHHEVVEVTGRIERQFVEYVTNIIAALPR
jgi:purine-nucleoside phosphorylase